MTIEICISTSCKRMGAIPLIEDIKKYLIDNNLENEVKLETAFCFECCGDPVAMVINGHLETGVNKDNLTKILDKYLK